MMGINNKQFLLNQLMWIGISLGIRDTSIKVDRQEYSIEKDTTTILLID